MCFQVVAILFMTSYHSGQEIDKSIVLQGYYTSATAQAYFYPPTNEHVYIHIEMFPGEETYMHLYIETRDRELCASFLLHRHS